MWVLCTALGPARLGPPGNGVKNFTGATAAGSVDRMPMRSSITPGSPVAAFLGRLLLVVFLALAPAEASLAEPGGIYHCDYYFAITRGVADSHLADPLKPVVFVVTLPLDLALLPFAAVGGFFGN